MFEKSNLLPRLATGSRGYTDKTHLRGFKSFDFLLVHEGGLRLCSYPAWRLEVAATQTKPTFVGSKALIFY
jgi:hypothetical protein